MISLERHFLQQDYFFSISLSLSIFFCAQFVLVDFFWVLSKEKFFHQKTPFYSNVLSSVTCALKKDAFFRGLMCRVSCFLEKPIFCSKLLSVARHFLWKLCGFFFSRRNLFSSENWFWSKSHSTTRSFLKQDNVWSKVLCAANYFCIKLISTKSSLFHKGSCCVKLLSAVFF